MKKENLKRSVQVLIISSFILSFACISKNSNLDDGSNFHVENKAVLIDIPESQIPFHNPANIEELLSTTYIVDTLYRQTVPNNLGSNDDKYELMFNRIVGIDTNNKRMWGNIFVLGPTNYFNPLFKEGNSYYIPFCAEPECESSVITKWVKTENEIKFSNYYKNLFYHKYGRIKVIDLIVDGGENYLLVEIYQPNEAATFGRTVFIVQEKISDRFEILHNQYLGEDTGDFTSCCAFEKKDGVLKVINKSDKTDSFIFSK
ncbi:MAG TPA: hypothetical protein PLY70_07730 [Saprospiraceae bacterium]|nr:hypothetical protein [Saprospiraceae bacterium]HPN69476.1 hypothetical protein [Saprospiraceae bacterium]